MPGTTRDVVHSSFAFTFKHTVHRIEILDTAGMRRNSKVKEDIEFYAVSRAKEAIKSVDIVLLLIDIRDGLTDADKKIARHATAHGKGIIFVYNKIDLTHYPGDADSRTQATTNTQERGTVAAQKDKRTTHARSAYAKKMRAQVHAADRAEFRYRFPHLAFAPCIHISALQKEGFHTLRHTIAKLWRVLNTRVPTPLLNTEVRKWMDALVQQRGIVFMYGAQVSIHPIKFVFFFKKVRTFPLHLSGYLANSIRRCFKLDSAPILIELKRE